MTAEEKIKGCLGRHPEWDDRRVANSCTASIEIVRAVRAGQPMPENSVPAPAQEAAGLISLEKVIQKYDIKSAIERELSTLPKGKLLEENDLCRRAAGTDRNRFRRTIENNTEAYKTRRVKVKIDDDGEPKWLWGWGDDIAAIINARDK